MSISEYDEDEDVCGETYDHDTETTYEDEESRYWICRRCGAEGWEDWHVDQ